jgi:hypothetical protein
MREITNATRKIKNRILAILAAPAAIPPNPKIAAIIATTRKMIVHRSIRHMFWFGDNRNNTMPKGFTTSEMGNT